MLARLPDAENRFREGTIWKLSVIAIIVHSDAAVYTHTITWRHLIQRSYQPKGGATVLKVGGQICSWLTMMLIVYICEIWIIPKWCPPSPLLLKVGGHGPPALMAAPPTYQPEQTRQSTGHSAAQLLHVCESQNGHYIVTSNHGPSNRLYSATWRHGLHLLIYRGASMMIAFQHIMPHKPAGLTRVRHVIYVGYKRSWVCDDCPFKDKRYCSSELSMGWVDHGLGWVVGQKISTNSYPRYITIMFFYLY